jgi:protein-arginine deiminase
MRMFSRTVALSLAALAVGACGKPAPEDPGANQLVNPEGNQNPNTQQPDPLKTIADLRVDVNRDGVISLDDPSDDLPGWDASHGAVFLANIDDDQKTCPTLSTLSDSELAKCNDAADEVVNGADDLLDLARIQIRPWPTAPDGMVATVTVPDAQWDKIRLFKKTNGEFTRFLLGTDIAADELRAGVELAIEAKDIVRDPAVWDGRVELTLEVAPSAESGLTLEPAKDTAVLRVAPVLTFHHLEPALTVYASKMAYPGSTDFRTDIRDGLTAAGSTATFSEQTSDDPWIQDFMEPGYMSMPAPGGEQHAIRVFYRSANLEQNSTKYPLRPAGRIVFTRLRGKDVAGVQQYDPAANRYTQSLNSFGNHETIPPHSYNGEDYPFGRVLRGYTASFHGDDSFAKMIDAQAVQPPVNINTEWLLVGHVDETISFIKAPTPRGWVALVGDPNGAKKMLEAEVQNGNGGVKMFVGKNFVTWQGQEIPAEVTISQVLANTDIMSQSSAAAANIDAQIAILKSETGLTDEEIIRIPFLFEDGGGGALAYIPGMVNGLLLDDQNFLPPDPHGPVINGKDIFKDKMEQLLAPFGVNVRWVEDWDLYHAMAGEVHCGTNAARKIPNAKWWESGR